MFYISRSYANLDCSILFWLNNRRRSPHSNVREIARRNSLIIPAACCCGLNEQGLFCEGGSNITGAGGELFTEIWEQEGVILADVFPGSVPGIREANPSYKGLRPDLYYY